MDIYLNNDYSLVSLMIIYFEEWVDPNAILALTHNAKLCGAG